jgi:hypothetical protein
MWNINGRKSPKWVKSHPKHIPCGIRGQGKDFAMPSNGPLTPSLLSQTNLSGFFLRYMTQMPLSTNMTKSSTALSLNDPDCKREKAVVAIMFWSDSTHLANFGTAKLWPVYMLFRNLSKYIRGQLNPGTCQHVAYIYYSLSTGADACHLEIPS